MGRIDPAHKTAVNAVKFLGGDILVSGDDDGGVRVWDLRTASKPVHSWKEHEGTVNGFEFNEEEQMVCSVANDGCLGVWDLRKGTLFAMSDSFEEDLTAVCVVKEG